MNLITTSTTIIICLTTAIVITAIFFIAVIDRIATVVRKKDMLAMNRVAAEYNQEGWMIFVDVRHKLVGLYKDSHSVSHDKIFFSKDLVKLLQEGETKFTVGDFRKIAIDIPKRSYRVLYEYKVPHETEIIFY